MSVLAYVLPVLLGAGLNLGIGVSPDQPLPFSYIDDPLVLELKSDHDAQVDLSLHAEAPGAPAVDLKADLQGGAP